jgi:predicted HAD superfamily Cof-like phosphohydrolase
MNNRVIFQNDLFRGSLLGLDPLTSKPLKDASWRGKNAREYMLHEELDKIT